MAFAYGMTISGIGALNQRLKQLESQAVTLDAAKKGVREGLRIIGDRAKRSIPKRYGDARKTIATGFKKHKQGPQRGEYAAKVGFGVGRDTAARLAAQTVRRQGHPGVGIGKQDIHWFVLGTKTRRRKSGASTGRMGPLSFAGVMKTATYGVEKTIKKELMAMVDRVRKS